MKHLICLLLSFISWDALHAQIEVILPHSNENFGYYKAVIYQDLKEKYDTIGPVLCLVSDSSHDHYNMVGAMWVYEVVSKQQSLNPFHFITTHRAWLDSKKKSLPLKVWNIYKLESGVLIYD